MHRRKRPTASPTDTSPVPESPSPAAGAASASESADAGKRQSLLVKGGVAAVVVLVAAGLIVLATGGGSKPNVEPKPPDDIVTQQAPEAPVVEQSTSSTAERLRRRSERLRNQATTAEASITDASPPGLKAVDEPRTTPATSKAAIDSTTAATPAVSPSAASFTRAVWAVAAAPDHHPLIDGVPARPQDGDWSSGFWTLVVPAGRHVVQLSAAQPPRMVESLEGFVEFYKGSVARFSTGDAYDFEKLIRATAATSGVFQEPLLPHHWGNYFWQNEDREAAVRLWNEAVRIDPGFAPAHLNLSHAHAESGDPDRARQEAQLAALLNVQDAFGISAHLVQLRQRLQLPPVPHDAVRFLPERYEESSSSLTVEQERGLRVLSTIAEVCVDPVERIRAINNIGVYLTHEQQPRLGLKYFRNGLREVLAMGQHPESAELKRYFLANLERGFKTAGMGEHVIYARMKDAP
jgi:tetratricopeptide (TPR) repeat protein